MDMPEELSRWVRQAAGKTVLVIGDLILDRYLYGDAERISPEAPVPVLRAVERREAVGGSANVAACLRALGCRVRCCGLVGTDRHGRRLTELLEAIEADASAVMTVSDRPTTAKTRFVGLAQHRHRQQLLRVDEEETEPLDAPAMERLIERALRAVRDADLICLEDYDKGVVSEPMVAAVVSVARSAGKPVLVDPARLSDYRRYAGVDLLTPNRDELSLAVGRRLESVEDVARAGAELIARLDVKALVATLDREGAVLVERDRWRHVPTRPRSVYDNTGAGDAVLAALAAALAAGAGLDAAVRLANVAGGLEVEKFGCVPIPAEELLAELRLDDRRRNGKLRSVDEVVAELALRRDRGETIAFTNGCFDLLHAGHVEFLRRCREEASVLV
ncbi:MAG: bifunctional heptose 7-phosphate kinase/heptose 1-phosphate adenyltransferase, partial [Planctomycetota bacterium]